MACNRGHSREQFHKCWGHMFCRGQSDVRNRVAGTFNACHAGMRQMRECASAVFGVTLCRPSPSVLDLTCSVYHISPRRACSGNAPSPSTCGNAACAAAISSLDTATLSLMKTGFTVSPRPQRVLAGACTRSKRVCRSLRERSGVLQGVQKGVWGALTRLAPPRAGLPCSARQRFAKDSWTLKRLFQFYDDLRARHRMLSPPSVVQHHQLQQYTPLHGSSHHSKAPVPPQERAGAHVLPLERAYHNRDACC